MQPNDPYRDPYTQPPVAPLQPSQPPISQEPQQQPAPTVEQSTISLEQQRLHERSKRQYPNLNLSDGEYIILAVRRYPIGLIIQLIIGILLIVASLTLLTSYQQFANRLAITGPLADASTMVTPLLIFCLVVACGMYIAYYIYSNNRFYLTNECIIQEIQTTLLTKREQTVSLGNIEDVSFTQNGMLQQIFGYGDIRLSTQGDENTYRFTYVASPKDQVAKLNNAVESFKNGRTVGEA